METTLNTHPTQLSTFQLDFATFDHNSFAMKFNEDARVKIPSILHLKQLECRCLSLKDTNSDIGTNIFTRNRKVLPTNTCFFVDWK
jgi:hypothetical protein